MRVLFLCPLFENMDGDFMNDQTRQQKRNAQRTNAKRMEETLLNIQQQLFLINHRIDVAFEAMRDMGKTDQDFELAEARIRAQKLAYFTGQQQLAQQ